MPIVPILALLIVWMVMPASLAAADVSDLVLMRPGTLPILLTAPHGGQAEIPGVPPRNVQGKPRGGSQYEVTRDTSADVIVQGVARYLETATGQAPYLVMARFHRKFIDANRPPAIAYDTPGAEPYYRLYHDSIRRFVDEIRSSKSAGLLIDLHGQILMPDTVIRGTLNGKAVGSLMQRAGPEAVTGPTGLFGLIEAQGLRVFPANAIPIGNRSEDAGFNGGFTVATYGSHQRDGIDAIQVELGAAYRKDAELQSTIDRLGKAIATFYEAHLKASKR